MDKWNRLRQRSTSNQGLSAAADNEGPRVSSLRSKDMASVHEHGQGKWYSCFRSQRALPPRGDAGIIGARKIYSRGETVLVEKIYHTFTCDLSTQSEQD
jgi:hypothetical protein